MRRKETTKKGITKKGTRITESRNTALQKNIITRERKHGRHGVTGERSYRGKGLQENGITKERNHGIMKNGITKNAITKNGITKNGITGLRRKESRRKALGPYETEWVPLARGK